MAGIPGCGLRGGRENQRNEVIAVSFGDLQLFSFGFAELKTADRIHRPYCEENENIRGRFGYICCKRRAKVYNAKCD